MNQEFNYHGGLTDVELEALKKMLNENIENVNDVSDTVTEHNVANEEARANLHIQMTNNKESITHICKFSE